VSSGKPCKAAAVKAPLTKEEEEEIKNKLILDRMAKLSGDIKLKKLNAHVLTKWPQLLTAIKTAIKEYDVGVLRKAAKVVARRSSKEQSIACRSCVTTHSFHPFLTLRLLACWARMLTARRWSSLVPLATHSRVKSVELLPLSSPARPMGCSPQNILLVHQSAALCQHTTTLLPLSLVRSTMVSLSHTLATQDFILAPL
jgi:hypothetical protein